MIGKISTGKSFAGCIAYCLHDKLDEHQEVAMKNRAELVMFNKCFGNERELVQQFNDVKKLNPNLSKPVMHISLSLSPGEVLSKDKLMEMSEHCAKDLGFDKNQYIAITHRDTYHQHLHIIANRIGFDKRTVSDSNNYKKMAQYCRKMELKYQLKQVLSPRRYLSQEQRNIPRFDHRKELLRSNIQQTLKECYNLRQFEQAMNKKGYQVIKGRGISFADEKKVTVKGSELNYSLQTIERLLAKQQLQLANRQRIQTVQQVHQQSWSVTKAMFTGNKKSIAHETMKPLPNSEEMTSPLIKKKRKKKRQSHHL
jgi:hypothetical protein